MHKHGQFRPRPRGRASAPAIGHPPATFVFTSRAVILQQILQRSPCPIKPQLHRASRQGKGGGDLVVAQPAQPREVRSPRDAPRRAVPSPRPDPSARPPATAAMPPPLCEPAKASAAALAAGGAPPPDASISASGTSSPMPGREIRPGLRRRQPAFPGAHPRRRPPRRPAAPPSRIAATRTARPAARRRRDRLGRPVGPTLRRSAMAANFPCAQLCTFPSIVAPRTAFLPQTAQINHILRGLCDLFFVICGLSPPALRERFVTTRWRRPG